MMEADYLGMISIVFDTICPWCFVGKYRLEAARKLLDIEGIRFDVEWRPYQLNPDMPDDGLDRRTYRATKFGNPARSDALDAQMTALGREIGLHFRFDLIGRTPNTLASHVMIADARRIGGSRLQCKAVEALFTAYFIEGRDVGRRDVLQDIAAQVGFEHEGADDAALRELVEQEDRDARLAGMRSVPSFLLNGHYLFSGAQPVDVLAETLRKAARILAGSAENAR